ncbi:MAG TPA: TonB-dependent receptor [Steroidobacteraceae bacterium]|nr:TonB-dependent receptor [Steroidobacteraceae bacterium]
MAGAQAPASGIEEQAFEPVVIVSAYGTKAVARDRVPSYVQIATADEIERAQSLDLTDFLNRSFASVNINHAQNNPLQPDFNFRGFTASPLLGLPQGLAVYQNGMRMNEPFGDTVSWDLISLSAVQSVQLLAGANPVFGLNSLGGALSLKMKDGFTFDQTAAEAYGGSFSRGGAAVQHGRNAGAWGYYANIDYFEEDGWRDFSDSQALRFFGSVSMKGDRSRLDVSAAFADSELRGNGAAPAELLQIDRSQVFTHPDITENSLAQLIVEGSFDVTSAFRVAGNAYFRAIDTDAFNGDGTIFEDCEFGADEFLVEEDFEDLNGDGECEADMDAGIAPVLDPGGDPIGAELDGTELDAINNVGRRKQESVGASLQLALDADLGAGRGNDFMLGMAFSDGATSFGSVVEVASLLENRGTSRTGILADEFRTQVDSELTTWSLYFVDTFDVTERLSLTASGRYDDTRVRLTDRSGQSPELNGNHQFARFNPALGIAWRVRPAATVYANIAQSTRAPTPVELACASEDAPCNLPNAFLADPPLDEVVANSFEAGAGGTLANGMRWHAGAFHIVNDDDILFQTTGGAQANVGFFENVGDTRRAGLELALGQPTGRVQWSVSYSLVSATFEDAFNINSPNHPAAAGDAELQVAPGAEIPGIPRHQLNAGIEFELNDRIGLGADASLRSGVHLRGDEVNLLPETSSYTVVNLRAEYRVSETLRLFGRIENLFDAEYESFGLLGDPGEVFPGFEDPRFFGAGPPFGAWVGVRATF